MSWSEFFQGFPILLFRSEGAVIFWALKGCPYWQSLVFVVCWANISLILIYYGTAVLINQLKRWPACRTVIEKIENWAVKKNNFLNGGKTFSHNWLTRKKKWFILLLAFVPYTHIIPGLGVAIIAATRIFNLKWGIWFLIAGNAFRWAIIIYHIYQGVSLLQ